MRSRWPLLALLCLLASLLVPGIASASTASVAETRVWAFDLTDQVGVGVDRSLTLELRPGCAPTYDDLASDSLLAARGGGKATEGIYEFTGQSGRKYVGQSGDLPRRIGDHARSGKLPPGGEVSTTEVLGGKTAREVAEQLRINELGGVRNLENIRNPIGPNRQNLLGGGN